MPRDFFGLWPRPNRRLGAMAEGTVGGGPLPLGRLKSLGVWERIGFQSFGAILIGSRMVGLVS